MYELRCLITDMRLAAARSCAHHIQNPTPQSERDSSAHSCSLALVISPYVREPMQKRSFLDAPFIDASVCNASGSSVVLHSRRHVGSAPCVSGRAITAEDLHPAAIMQAKLYCSHVLMRKSRSSLCLVATGCARSQHPRHRSPSSCARQ